MRWHYAAMAAWNLAAVLACAAIAALNMIQGDIVVGSTLAVLALINAVLLVQHTLKYRRFNSGSDRQADPHHPDPQAGSLTFHTCTLTSASFATAPAGASVTLETVNEDMPILAHRAAYLAIGRSGIKFKPLHRGDAFGVDSIAHCDQSMAYYMTREHRTPHRAPGNDCECGYYAVPSDVDSWHGSYTVDLLVEHEKGYRAEHQRVIECRLPLCPYCRQPVEHIYFVDGASTAMGCARHFPGIETTVVEVMDRATTAPAGYPGTRKVEKNVTVLTRVDLEVACVVPIMDDES